MADENDDSPPKRKRRRRRTPEEVWIREFLGFTGTDNITRFVRADLNGVSLVKAVHVLCRGDCIRTEKCDGPGTVCTFIDEDHGEIVEVVAFFIANESVLEIRGARVIQEVKNEPDAA
jgi:hypothetical protein